MKTTRSICGVAAILLAGLLVGSCNKPGSDLHGVWMCSNGVQWNFEKEASTRYEDGEGHRLEVFYEDGVVRVVDRWSRETRLQYSVDGDRMTLTIDESEHLCEPIQAVLNKSEAREVACEWACDWLMVPHEEFLQVADRNPELAQEVLSELPDARRDCVQNCAAEDYGWPVGCARPGLTQDESFVCYSQGPFTNARSQAIREAACRASEECIEHGECHPRPRGSLNLDLDECEARSREDCEASRICESIGWCCLTRRATCGRCN